MTLFIVLVASFAASETADKLSLLDVPDLNELVITGGDQKRTIRVESDTFNWS